MQQGPFQSDRQAGFRRTASLPFRMGPCPAPFLVAQLVFDSECEELVRRALAAVYDELRGTSLHEG